MKCEGHSRMTVQLDLWKEHLQLLFANTTNTHQKSQQFQLSLKHCLYKYQQIIKSTNKKIINSYIRVRGLSPQNYKSTYRISK